MANPTGPLRSFQQEIVKGAATYPSVSQTWIAMRNDRQGWLVSAGEMSEAMVAPAISNIGNMPPGVRGIAAARGKVFTVLDMPKILTGVATDSSEAGGWMIAVDPDFMAGVALWWPLLEGMVPSTSFSQAPASVSRSRFSGGVFVDEAGEYWQVLDVDAVLSYMAQHSMPGVT